MTKQMICPECKKTVDFEASNCPHCGIAITDEIRKKARKQIFQGAVILLVLLVAVVFGISRFFSGDDTDMTLPGKPIGYYKLTDSFKMETDANGNPRDMHIFWIKPKSYSKEVTYADLISTVMVAADKYYKEKKNVPIIKVVMLIDHNAPEFYDSALAYITYIPDKKGFNGVTESPIWREAVARERGFSKDEIDFLFFYEQVASQQHGISKDVLLAEVASLMGRRINSNPFENKLLNLKISDQNTIIEK